MRRRKREGRQMTALEASQRAALWLMAELGGKAQPAKRRRNRGAARRAKIAARHDRLYAEELARSPAPRALALARNYNKMVEAERMSPA